MLPNSLNIVRSFAGCTLSRIEVVEEDLTLSVAVTISNKGKQQLQDQEDFKSRAETSCKSWIFLSLYNINNLVNVFWF